MTPKALILAHAEFLDRSSWETVLDWVEKGGTFIYASVTAPVTIEGATDLWERMSPEGNGPVRRRTIGQGTVIVLPSGSPELVAEVLLDGRNDSVPLLPNHDGRADGLWCTAFRNRLLYFNFTDRPVAQRLRYEKNAFPEPMGKPEALDRELRLEPREITVINLTH